MKIYPYGFFWEFCSFSTYIYVFDPFWVNFCIQYEAGVQISFACVYCCLSTICWREYTFSSLNVLGTLVENELTIDVWVYLWTLNSILLIYMAIFMLVTYYFDYCSFLVSFEIGKWEFSILSFFFKIFLLFSVPCKSMRILGSVCQFLLWSQLRFW